MYKTHARTNGAVSGPFLVNDQCIICAMCGDIAPEHFRLGDDEALQVVYQQPESPEQLSRCREALEQCPVEAIEEHPEHRGTLDAAQVGPIKPTARTAREVT